MLGGIADFADELAALLALVNAHGREQLPLSRLRPLLGHVGVAGEAMVEDEQALAHLANGVLGSCVVLIAEHQVKNVSGGGGGGEGRARIMVLTKTVLNGVFSQFCCGRGQFRVGSNGWLGKEEMQGVVVAVM